MERYKKKSLKFSNGSLSRALRSVKTDDIRKDSRNKRLSILRHLKEEDFVAKETSEDEKENLPKKPLSREERLRKWKEEKRLKKILENKSKKPPFKVGGPLHECLPSASLYQSHIKKDSFVSKVSGALQSKIQRSIQQGSFVSKVPRALPLKIQRSIQQVPSKVRGCFINKAEKFGKLHNIVEKTLTDNSKPRSFSSKNTIKTALSNNPKEVKVQSKPNFVPANYTTDKSKKNNVSKMASKPAVVKSTANMKPVSRPSFAPENFVFSPSQFGYICERFEEAFKATLISTPIKSARTSEKIGSFKTENSNLLCEKYEVLSVCTPASNAEKTKTKNLDMKNGVSLCSPRRSLRFQDKRNGKEISADENLFVNNSKEEIKANTSNLKNGVSLCTPRRSVRLQNKNEDKELPADKSLDVNNLKGIKDGKLKKNNLISSPAHYRSVRFDNSIIFEENEPSVFEDSSVVATPAKRSQRTRMTDEFKRLTLDPFLEAKPEPEEKELPLKEVDKEPSLLYTPLRKSIINVESDMMFFSPNI